MAEYGNERGIVYFLYKLGGNQIIEAISNEFDVTCLKSRVVNGILSLEFAHKDFPTAYSGTSYIPNWEEMSKVELAVSFTMMVCRMVDGEDWQNAICEAQAAQAEQEVAAHEAWELEHASDPD